MGDLTIYDRSFTTKDGRHFPIVNKVRFGNKSLTFYEQGRETTITFQKKSHDGQEYLEIQTRKTIKQKANKVCEFGHAHQVEEIICDEFGWAYMDWGHVQSLVDWLQLGSWSSIKKTPSDTERGDD